MIRKSDCDQIVSQGTLRDETARVDYYTTAPAPTQWTAVGVLIRHEAHESTGITRQMLVGTGPSEASAITELANRFTRIQRDFLRRQGHLGYPENASERAQYQRARLPATETSDRVHLQGESGTIPEREAKPAFR